MEKLIADAERAAFWYTMLELSLLVLFVCVMYLVTKAAVKNGINESRLGQRLGKEQSLYEKSRKDIPPLDW